MNKTLCLIALLSVITLAYATEEICAVQKIYIKGASQCRYITIRCPVCSGPNPNAVNAEEQYDICRYTDYAGVFFDNACTGCTAQYEDGLCTQDDTRVFEDCLTCPSKCNSCTVECDKCTDENRTAPECQCPAEFYDLNGSSCPPCLTRCATCNNDYECIECKQDGRVEITCLCPSHQFENEAGTCQDCGPLCLECNTEFDCTICKHNDAGLRLASSCECVDGYVDIENVCTKCDLQCMTCSDSTSNCDSCTDNGRTVTLPDCVCDSNQYSTANQESCPTCENQCATCRVSADNCLTCTEVTRQYPLCACDDGTYDVYGYKCDNCLNVCATCSNDTSCDTCKDSKNRDTPECSCGDQEYDNNGESCVSCNEKCDKCRDGVNVCEKCAHPDEHRDVPDCDCYVGFWDDGVECIACDLLCVSCSNANSCDVCKNAEFRNEACECIFGYYDHSGVCTEYEGPCSEVEYHKADEYGEQQCEHCKIMCKTCPVDESYLCDPTCFNGCTQADLDNSTTCTGCIIDCGPCEGEYCDGCKEGCATCDNATSCTSCTDTNKTLPECTACAEGYEANANTGLCEEKVALAEETPALIKKGEAYLRKL